jgi:hypothetical protein
MAVHSLQKEPARGRRPFEKGRSGNRAGRPRGTSDFDKRLRILENAGAEQSANAVGWYGR